MKTKKVLLAALPAGAALLLAASAAHADGLAARPSLLSDSHRASLEAAVDAYRAEHPEAFEAVRSPRGIRPEVYKSARNPVPLVGRELRRLGPAALLPMLEALALDAPKSAATAAEREALSVGMLEAVAVLRDARSAPVLRAVFEAGGQSPAVRKSAAEGLGALCGDDELAALVAHLGTGDERRLAAIVGLGECRRAPAAAHLAALAAGELDEASAQAVAASLGRIGSSWAWKALGPAREAEGLEVRQTAAKALVDCFARGGKEARSAAKKALGMVEHPAAFDRIAARRVGASAETVVALDELERALGRVLRR